MTATENEIKAGGRYYSVTFKKNVDVVRVFAKSETCTVRVAGGGLMAGKLMTMRGIKLADLSEKKSYAELDEMGAFNR